MLRNNLLAAAFIFVVLQFWRPYFFLTDDNIDSMLPFFNEMGNRLLTGQSPFYTDHLFGGHYNLLRDPDFFNWHPLYLAVSLLAGTPWNSAIIDVNVFFLLMISAAGFTCLAWYLRRELPLQLSDGWIMFYTLSYTYSMIALTTGASWITFVGSISALPWLALGILQKNWRWGIAIVTLAAVHQFLGGHLEPDTSNCIFLSLFALGLSLFQRSIQPLGVWLAGCAFGIVLISPLLIPMLHGFGSSLRSSGTTLEDMQSFNIPASQFLTAVFAGMGVWMFDFSHQYGRQLYTTYTVALGACAASWCLVPALISRAKWRGMEVMCVILMIFAAVLISRPVWVSEIMLQLPLFKAMRWPFRELVQFIFFLHLFILVRPPGALKKIQTWAAWGGALFFVIPLFLYPLPPTFNAMNWDRELLTGGGFKQYWDHVRPLLKPDDKVAVIIPFDVYEGDRFEDPNSLLGTHNYANMAGIVNVWGYSPTAPLDQVDAKIYAYYPFGAYRPEQRDYLLSQRPDLKIITLESLYPLKITLSSKDGPTIDLTPYVPPRKSVPGHKYNPEAPVP